MMRVFFSVMLAGLLMSCGRGDPSFVRLGDYECDAGEAAVRHLVKNLPDVSPGLPREYCIIKALDQRAVDMDFLQRFKDLGVPLVSADVLSEQPETHYPINPKSGLSPVLLQLQMVRQLTPESYEIDANWAFKKTFERSKLTVKKVGEKWLVQDAKLIEGNAR